MHLMNEIRRLTDAHQRRPGIYILYPSINLFIGTKGEIKELVLDLQFDTERFHIHSLNIDYIG